MAKRVKGEWAEGTAFTHKSFTPYTLAIGQLTMAWNDLHTCLCILFVDVMGAGQIDQYLAIWNSNNSDRSQRAMLKAAAQTSAIKAISDRFEDIKWLCDEVMKIEEDRNNAIHSPFWGTPVGGKRAVITPLTGLGHRRAANYYGKNVLGLLRWHRDMSTALRNYAMEMNSALSGQGAWPEKPKLPKRPVHNTRQPRRRP